MLSLMYGLILFILCGLLLLSWRHERTIDRIEQTQLKQISVASNIVTVHNATVDHYDSEIDQIIARMDQITADIAELNKENISDHRDLVDIRQRYINYRTPVKSNGGVDWAPEFPSQEDL